MFADSLSTPGLTIDWSNGDPIWTRFAVKASPQSNLDSTLTLVLEGLPLGKVDIDKMSQESKEVINGGTAKTFLLWSCEAQWSAPSQRAFLATTPGIYVKNLEHPPVSDPMIRWFVAVTMEMSRRGAYYQEIQGPWFEYLAAPTREPIPEAVPMGFVLPNETDNNEFGGKYLPL